MGTTSRLTRVAEGISETIFRVNDRVIYPIAMAGAVYILVHVIVALGRGTL